MPTRLVREGMNDSERVDALSQEAELFFRRLINVVDDYGRFEADSVLIISRAFPRRATKLRIEQIEGWLEECTAGPEPLIALYNVGRKRYLQILKFDQRVRTPSKYPDPPPQICGKSPLRCESQLLTVDGQLTVKNLRDAAHAGATPTTPITTTPMATTSTVPTTTPPSLPSEEVEEGTAAPAVVSSSTRFI